MRAPAAERLTHTLPFAGLATSVQISFLKEYGRPVVRHAGVEFGAGLG